MLQCSQLSPAFTIRGVGKPLSQENQGIVEGDRHYKAFEHFAFCVLGKHRVAGS